MRVARTICAIACACSLLAAGSALGAHRSVPVLSSPRNGQRVHASHFRLIVKAPGVPRAQWPLYATISPQRTLDSSGNLAQCDGTRCDFVQLTPWRHHPGYWIFTPLPGYPGYWAATPGRYWWQAEYAASSCQATSCEIASAIHWFRVV
jgi:hypothetical protein